MSRREREVSGKVPLHTLRADIDFGIAEAHTTFGVIGVKVWIYRGEILPKPKVTPAIVAPAPWRRRPSLHRHRRPRSRCGARRQRNETTPSACCRRFERQPAAQPSVSIKTDFDAIVEIEVFRRC